ncbi:MAG TPA: hypothetical protein VG188_06140 [Solirubrobacteraceae bacterium]|nr:hypothetical protein [Solirubrobacteraceae bacterium]
MVEPVPIETLFPASELGKLNGTGDAAGRQLPSDALTRFVSIGCQLPAERKLTA